MADMPIPADEIQRHTNFIVHLTGDLGAASIPQDAILWHYTNGPALLAIIDSMSIFSTHISCLNDTSELRYGMRLFQEALAALRCKVEKDATALALVDGALNYFKENPEFPRQAVVPDFVACLSEEKDDLSQWRAYAGGENGYAIGFKAGDLRGCRDSIVARINYDHALHRTVANKVAEAMVMFFLEGIGKYAPIDKAAWGGEFLESWERSITMLAPLVKDPAFIKERECRIVKGFRNDELDQLKFIQKAGMISRHLPLKPGADTASDSYRLPISEIMVGPCRRPETSRTSVDTLLRQKGYPTGLVSISKIPFQIT
jgi:hypothetical protein